MVFITGQNLPASFLLVVMAPDPIAATMLSGKEAGRFVERDYLFPFGRRISRQMPDRLRRFIGARCVEKSVVKVIDGWATIHVAVAIGQRFPRALAATGYLGRAGFPLPTKLKNR